MDPDVLLRVIAAIAGFLLKSTLAFAACAAVSRLAYSPKVRFILWASFIYGTAVYWLYLAAALSKPLAHSPAEVTVTSQAVASSFPIWQIPSSWAFPLGLTLRIMGIAYLMAVGYAILAHLKKHRYLRWVLRFTSEPPAEIAATFASVAREFHDNRSRLLILQGATSPVTFGWVRPIVLLPGSCVEQDRSELKDILRHELHHVHRRDAIWNELALAARGLLIFHPAIWYAVRKMQFDRELACDLAVVARCPARRAEYAECLVRFARLNVVSEANGWGIDFAASPHHLTVRVHSILSAAKTFPSWTRYLRVACGLTVSALFLGVAPSLAILVSFAHNPISSSFPSIADRSPSQIPGKIKTSRRGHSVPGSAKGQQLAEAPRPEQQAEERPQIDLPPGTLSPALSLQSASGPQLRRRGDPSAPASKAPTSQIIALEDVDAKGQPIQSDDRKQALQQTATAALGIYQRISTIDRR